MEYEPELFTAMDNGGKTVIIKLTFEKEVDLVSDNDKINSILCLFAKEL